MKFAYLIEPPFNFRDEAGKVLGHDVDLARQVFRELGESFEPVETSFARLLPGLAAGAWRMTTGLIVTRERQRTAFFTRPIWALPDGLLVRRGNPLGLAGYRSLAEQDEAVLAVVEDQLQHRSALALGVPAERLRIFSTYGEAAAAVRDGAADAYASVARAHSGFTAQNPAWAVETVEVPPAENPPAAGAFALARSEAALCAQLDEILDAYLGSESHRDMAETYGFSEDEVNKAVLSAGPLL